MIGILALQGGFEAHQKSLEQLGIPNRLVKTNRSLEDVAGLILPGGESTTMLKLMEAYDMFDTLARFNQTGKPVLGTCAGAILMCSAVQLEGDPHDQQRSFGWIPATIDRNAYGSQQESFQTTQDLKPWDLQGVKAFFIRAPRFNNLGEGVRVISRFQNDVTGVEFNQMVAISYHPELARENRFHETWYRRNFT